MIKLKPVGKKKQISYRIIVGERGAKLKGKFIDDLGWYNPHTDKFSISAEKAKKWIANGAQPSDSLHNILVNAKVIEGNKIPLHKKSKQEKPVESAASNTQGSVTGQDSTENKSSDIQENVTGPAPAETPTQE